MSFRDLLTNSPSPKDILIGADCRQLNSTNVSEKKQWAIPAYSTREKGMCDVSVYPL
jgi:hypothetical protein